jgi:hypothetical protein
MKRKLAGLLAALLVLTMGTTVYAAVSPTAEDVKAQAESAAKVVKNVNATDAGGNMIELTQNALDNDDYSATLEKVESLGSSTELLGAVELEAPNGFTGDSITVTLHMSGITAEDGTDNIRVLHYNGFTWETLTPNAVSAGSVTVTLTSLSPVAVVRTADTADSESGSDGTDKRGPKHHRGTGKDSTDTTDATLTPDATNTTDATSTPDATNTTDVSSTPDANNTTDATNTGGSNTNTNTSNTGSSSSGGNTQTNNNYQTVNVYTTGNGTTGNGTSASAQPSASTSTTSPKTGASLPALPIIAVLAAMGIAVCGKKARSLS